MKIDTTKLSLFFAKEQSPEMRSFVQDAVCHFLEGGDWKADNSRQLNPAKVQFLTDLGLISE